MEQTIPVTTYTPTSPWTPAPPPYRGRTCRADVRMGYAVYRDIPVYEGPYGDAPGVEVPRDTSPVRVFVGMMRPPWEEIAARGLPISCPCTDQLRFNFLPLVREHWQLGHFDYPVYREVKAEVQRG